MKTRIRVFIILAGIIVLIAALATGARLWVDVLWFDRLSYLSVFTTMLLTRIWLWLAFFALFAVFSGLNVLVALRKNGIQTLKIPRFDVQQTVMTPEMREAGPYVIRKKAIVATTAVILFLLAVIMAGIGSGKWDAWLKILNRTAFNVADPLFNRDISFYVFMLPFYRFLKNWSMAAVILTAAVVGLLYLLSGNLRRAGRGYAGSARATRHILFLALLVGILFAWHYWLRRYSLLLSPRGIIFGATYTDVKLVRIAYYIMIAVSLFTAGMIGAGIIKGRFRHMLIGYGILIGAAILITGIVPAVFQQISVIPNQLQKELPYIKDNIEYTRRGYHLQNVEVQAFPVADSLSAADFAPGTDVVKHIRIWDDRPLTTTYKQLQEFRLYYDFKQVSTDRYHFPGDFRQVMLSLRELNYDQLPQNAKTWVNQRLQYTHGYGMVMSPVNAKGPEGLPLFLIKDIPPKVSVPLALDRPEIYYGQETTQYVIANTKLDEFDYPKGSANVFTSYGGSGGIPTSNFWRRLLFAVHLLDSQILFTNYLKPDSRLMIYRDIQRRVPKIAPFLRYDPSAYAVVSDGKVYWMMDAYTTTDMYPYSTPSADGYNYIRNSIKITVDAYNGDVSYYIIDPSDPLARTYARIFPRMFKDISEMPEGLRAHIRYPRYMFSVQASIYETYHMTDPEVFYNKEDMWTTPLEIYGDAQTEMVPYYIINSFPDLPNPQQYVLMFPFTPTNKNNMVAWIAAFCDPQQYGKIIEYQFPKEKLIFGPLQIESRIDQNSEISQLFTLWSQSGSQIIRGNLLVIPVKDSLIYVEPVYLVSANSQLPELKVIIVSYQDRLAFALTLEEALGQIFGTTTARVQAQAAGPAPAALPSLETIGRLIQQALSDYNSATQKLRQGDFAGYGELIKQLQSVLEELAAQTGQGAAPSTQ